MITESAGKGIIVMQEQDWSAFLNAVMNIGREMIRCGAEIWRVEDSLTRIFQAYRCKQIEVYASTALIVCTIKSLQGGVYTQSARVLSVGTDLSMLEELNRLSRDICRHRPGVEEIEKKIKELSVVPKMNAYHAFGYAFYAGAFSVFFGGNVRDGIASALVALILFFIDRFTSMKRLNVLIYTLIMTFVSGSLAVVSVWAGVGCHLDKVTIGLVMIFIPTLVLVNGIRDMFHRDIISGTFRIVEASLVAVTIALGIGLSIVLFGGACV